MWTCGRARHPVRGSELPQPLNGRCLPRWRVQPRTALSPPPFLLLPCRPRFSWPCLPCPWSLCLPLAPPPHSPQECSSAQPPLPLTHHLPHSCRQGPPKPVFPAQGGSPSLRPGLARPSSSARGVWAPPSPAPRPLSVTVSVMPTGPPCAAAQREPRVRLTQCQSPPPGSPRAHTAWSPPRVAVCLWVPGGSLPACFRR